MLWFTRNKWVHERNFSTRRRIAELTRSYIQKQIMISNKIDTITPTSVEWKPLDSDIVKINFDDVFDRLQHRSVSGLIARNDSSQVPASQFTLHADIGASFAAEAQACAQVVEMGVEMQVRKLEVEGDALTVIKKCKKKDLYIYEISAFISDIQHRFTSFQGISFTHVPRLGNLITHILATESLRRNEMFDLEGSLLDYAVKLLGSWYRSE